MKLVIDIIGWIGSVAVIAAYGLNSYQKIKSDSYLFLVLNLTGGICLIIYSYYYTAYANTQEGDEAEVLSMLIENYKNEYFPIINSAPNQSQSLHHRSLGDQHR